MEAGTSGDRPVVRKTNDSFLPESVRTIPNEGLSRESWRRFMGALSAMTAGGAGAEDAYQRALDGVREDGEEAAAGIARIYDALEEDWYHERWALVQLLTDLAMAGSTSVLAEIVHRPVPEERSEDTVHGVSTVTEEVVIRTTAIEGLSRQLGAGDERAAKALFPVLQHKYLSMRRAAWHAFVDSGRSSFIDRAREVLAARDEVWIADLWRIPVQDAGQASPEPSVSEPNGAAPPAPFGEERSAAAE